jgi:hypothetical protein
MKTLKVLYHMARADFFERSRRYNFLIMSGLVAWLGYISASQQLILRVPPDYVGIINSHWIGALMTMTVSLVLGWFGFYLVKGSVSRDYETGVGQILATTPLSRASYTIGKWLSNFAILGIMVLIMMVAGIVMNLFIDAKVDVWAIAAPLVFVALPCMAVVAAVAVLFESIPWLRGGMGNIIYFFLFLVGISTVIESDNYHPLFDFAGIQLIGNHIAHAAKVVYPESSGGFALSVTEGLIPKYFPYDGISWTGETLLYRLFFLLISIGIVLIAAVFFDRFDPKRVFRIKERSESLDVEPTAVRAVLPASIHLTPLTESKARFRFVALFVAELKLMLKGNRWWWYAAAVVMVAAQFANEPEMTHIVLVISWLWPILLLSKMGSRETRYNTSEIVFSAPRPVIRQLPAAWLAAFTLVAVSGSGAVIKFLIAGDFTSVLPWLAGALFIPSMALASGVLTRSSKFFEVVYVLWMYLILQKIPALDFVGITPQSPWIFYIMLAGVLCVLAAIMRQKQRT